MRWRTDAQGLRWLEGWASRDALRAWAAKLGHDIDVWYALVAHGPYKRELGRCKYCNKPAAWGLVYQGKIGGSVGDTLGAHRVPVKRQQTLVESQGDEEDERDALAHPLDPYERTTRGLHRKPLPCLWGPALTEPCRQLKNQTTQRRAT